MTDFCSSPLPGFCAFGSPLTVEQNTLSGKRRRSDDEENIMVPYPHSGGDMSDIFNPGKRHRSRLAPSSFQKENRINELEQTIQNLQRQVVATREECCVELQKKQEEIDHVSAENNALKERLNDVEINNSRVLEENRLLKRAVHIQEGRQKEVMTQNQQLKQFLNQAADQISALERSNATLRSHMGMFNQPEPVISHRPPDIY
mmetsp:Transcript_13552/g.20346  ORF Transcript_13552/g.20346 Transcript_13552/m.20346 type:complete len:203 (+) Transcript_13552:134-742(+)|eukprot:CAMPEP_0185028004 /NCGR_PEP_ID=MMETSP1103-20130426/13415_1 /TAXON_ID=36769 /ORGANISM="Paraphysomonas bandaiensis, Strain Caron Lab Isolate" /LENGTH=202 /DNA_ID=CAMNT_0027562229 /DNA_START=79 /DNA_END=687 /DNA_ORIENTATION=-